MKTTYLRPTLDQKHAQIHMEPEIDRDLATCERLIDDDLASGCGYDPDTGAVLHVQITL